MSSGKDVPSLVGKWVRYIEAGGRNPRSGIPVQVLLVVLEAKGGHKALLRFEDGYLMTAPGSCLRPLS